MPGRRSSTTRIAYTPSVISTYIRRWSLVVTLRRSLTAEVEPARPTARVPSSGCPGAAAARMVWRTRSRASRLVCEKGSVLKTMSKRVM